MLDAACAKARRGELRISVPMGYIWHREVGLDPDQIHFPRPSDCKKLVAFE